MGRDAEVYCRTSDGRPPYKMDNDCVRKFRDTYGASYGAQGAPTHDIDLDCERYYAPGYERGSWPRISSTLMKLFESPNVEAIWYGPDDSGAELFTKIEFLAYCAHYMKVGNRPWDDAVRATNERWGAK